MIFLSCSNDMYTYNTYHLAKAFFPEEEMQQNVAENMEDVFQITFPDGRVFVVKTEDIPEGADRGGKKYAVDVALYKACREYTGRDLAWGILTGVRPTKIAMQKQEQGMDEAIRQLSDDYTGICFVNLVEFDSEYGHRRNPVGYARCLEAFDKRIGEFIAKMGEDDLLMVTADHGNDPTAHGTDHTREKVPLLCYSPRFRSGHCLGERKCFAQIGATALANFGLQKEGNMVGEPIEELLEHNA